MLPVEVCGAHCMTLPQLEALKYMPTLLFRVEVRPPPFLSHASTLVLNTHSMFASFRTTPHPPPPPPPPLPPFPNPVKGDRGGLLPIPCI